MTLATPYVENDFIRQVIGHLPAPLIMVNQHNQISYINRAAEQFLALSSSSATGRHWSDIIMLSDQKGLPINTLPMQMKQATRLPDNSEWWMVTSMNKTNRPVQLSVASIDDPGTKQLYGAAVVFHELGEVHRLVERLLHQCSHDHLTGLVNRSVFDSRLLRALQSAASGTGSHAMLYMDLNGFKTVNDRYGHKIGDALLKNIARRFSAIIRDRDTLARYGGDEFLLLLEHCDIEHAMATARLIRQAVREVPLHWNNESITIDVSIGITVINRSSPSSELLISQADAACYVAKRLLTEHIRIYQEGDSELAFSEHNTDQRTPTHIVQRAGDQMTMHTVKIQSQPKANLTTGDSKAHLNATSDSVNRPSYSEHAVPDDVRRSMIAVAAYYKSLFRKSSTGSEQDDWLIAEKEINRRLSSITEH